MKLYQALLSHVISSVEKSHITNKNEHYPLFHPRDRKFRRENFRCHIGRGTLLWSPSKARRPGSDSAGGLAPGHSAMFSSTRHRRAQPYQLYICLPVWSKKTSLISDTSKQIFLKITYAGQNLLIQNRNILEQKHFEKRLFGLVFFLIFKGQKMSGFDSLLQSSKFQSEKIRIFKLSLLLMPWLLSNWTHFHLRPQIWPWHQKWIGRRVFRTFVWWFQHIYSRSEHPLHVPLLRSRFLYNKTLLSNRRKCNERKRMAAGFFLNLQQTYWRHDALGDN